VTSSASPRRAAADVLIAVLERGRTLDDALSTVPSFKALEGRDRAFARAIVSATLRRLGGLDAVIAKFLARPLPKAASVARALLRTGAAQLLVLGTPAHAVVSEAVELARADDGAQAYAKLINAVLRKVATEGQALLDAEPASVDLPAWLRDRWRAAYGAEATEAIALAERDEPPLDLSAREEPARWAEALGGTLLPSGTIRLPASAPAVETLPGYEDGAWWVQDAAAALPVRLLGEVRGLRVLDLCAAPGGKTMQLAAAGARVTALDKSDRRLNRVRENLARTKLNAHLIVADALTFAPGEPFDAVLLDAPCTATGTLRRRPDVAWSKTAADVPALAEIQAKLIEASAGMLKPGGVLVFCTCSLEPEEGESAVAAALEAGAPLALERILPDEVPGLSEAITAQGTLRTLPSFWADRGGMDGFFAARLRRL
jgi:16S rRNA (cytosine967-C5)-methyltransferase